MRRSATALGLTVSRGGQAAATVMAVLLAVVLPLVVHAVPVQGGVPLGSRLLPMFLAPALVVLLGWGPWAVLATSLGPLLNHLLTGRPDGELLWRLSLEVSLFAGVVAAGWRVAGLRWVLLPAGYLVVRGVVVLTNQGDLRDALSGLATALSVSWPGLLMLAATGAGAAWNAKRRREEA